VVFTSEQRKNKEVNTRIDKANSSARAVSLWSQNGSFQTLQISVFKLVCILILTSDHKSWERVLSSGISGNGEILQKFYGMTLRNKVHSCEIHKAMNAELLLVERSQVGWFGYVTRVRQGKSAGYTHRKAAHRLTNDQTA